MINKSQRFLELRTDLKSWLPPSMRTDGFMQPALYIKQNLVMAEEVQGLLFIIQIQFG